MPQILKMSFNSDEGIAVVMRLLMSFFLLCRNAVFKNLRNSFSSSMDCWGELLFFREIKAESTLGGGEKDAGGRVK